MSNLIKSSFVVSLDDLKRLEIVRKHQPASGRRPEDAGPGEPDERTAALREQILRDAEAEAEERVRQAAEHAERLKREAEQEIARWWEERRAQDLEITESARRAGYEQGYAEGRAEAEEAVRREWEGRLGEAKALIEEAYRMKESIIQEAEPFLVELSVAIAGKIVDRVLERNPEWVIDLIRKALARRREQGIITLCVAPDQLAFVLAARDELEMAVDSQAELQIVPDPTVTDRGCVIRTSFGSIDARIDTQLEEIKKALLQAAAEAGERRQTDEGLSA
ncbi:MAG: flagellar assembly protein FliH [Thermobacillus sp. ZCTH02-B1]|uniref:flagellar assembly protein FliH n=1 Tax=Thermobacillus sp. ZCTH02-B1 TaxID=1858795 RepID=UPI000B57C448|nr:flagellar assembly protein FliH [Thermobacillus sp. ZCTH02-B1]OUM96982.1 MAG: flagellar assembly protein FliH [Thermobacillus sp. ZCTH02-B1]